ncbi:MAG TPA: response regulator transcription factor [Fibrobacteraceae bacterium]|nr:response regulator transcription factor [Fibrobacteraceae bacterium]
MDRIFIVEDEIIIAKDLEQTLLRNGYSVVGIASSYAKAIQKIQEVEPSLILCDINLGAGKNGLDLMQDVHEFRPIPFIIISAYSDQQTLHRASALTPENYLTKPISETQLLTSIRLALENRVSQGLPTVRELEIVQEIAKGKSAKEISAKLDISFHTVESHRKNLLRKYGIQTSTELVRLAVSQNWIHFKASP